VYVLIVIFHYYGRLPYYFQMVLLPFKRPALVGANLFAQFAVLAAQGEILLSKLQRFCLKIENRLLKIERLRFQRRYGCQ